MAKTKSLSTKRGNTTAKKSGNASGFSVALSPEQGLNRYLQEIRKFPMLEKQQEFMLAKRWAEHEDTGAAEQMVTSHLRLVAKIAMGYRGYGLPIGEVISEGNVGLMQAVKKFDPDKGFRFRPMPCGGSVPPSRNMSCAHGRSSRWGRPLRRRSFSSIYAD